MCRGADRAKTPSKCLPPAALPFVSQDHKAAFKFLKHSVHLVFDELIRFSSLLSDNNSLITYIGDAFHRCQTPALELSSFAEIPSIFS